MVGLFSVGGVGLALRFSIHGGERIPRTGTYIVIANHLGWLDALTLAIVFPIEPRIHFLADPTGMMRRRREWALIKATGGVRPVGRAVARDRAALPHVNPRRQLAAAGAPFPPGDFRVRPGHPLPRNRAAA